MTNIHELLNGHFDTWVVNEVSGISHVEATQGVTGCGIEYASLPNFTKTYGPTDIVCGRCKRSRDWHVKGVIAKETAQGAQDAGQ